MCAGCVIAAWGGWGPGPRMVTGAESKVRLAAIVYTGLSVWPQLKLCHKSVNHPQIKEYRRTVFVCCLYFPAKWWPGHCSRERREPRGVRAVMRVLLRPAQPGVTRNNNKSMSLIIPVITLWWLFSNRPNYSDHKSGLYQWRDNTQIQIIFVKVREPLSIVHYLQFPSPGPDNVQTISTMCTFSFSAQQHFMFPAPPCHDRITPTSDSRVTATWRIRYDVWHGVTPGMF